MKLKNDFLWQSYCYVATRDKRTVLPPTSLCQYFWTAVIGVIGRGFDAVFSWFENQSPLACLIDAAVALTPVLVAMALHITNTSIFIALPCTFLLIFSALMCVIAPMKGIFWGWNKFVATNPSDGVKRTVMAVALGLPTWLGISLILQTPTLASTLGKFLLWAPFMAIGMLLGIIVCSVILGGIFLGLGWCFGHAASTSVGSVILRYLKAVKERVCPMVEPPEEYLEEDKRAIGAKS